MADRTRDLRYLERVRSTPRGGDYLCSGFTLADVSMMILAMVLDVDAMNLDAFPRAGACLKLLRERPSYRAISPHTKVAEASTGA